MKCNQCGHDPYDNEAASLRERIAALEAANAELLAACEDVYAAGDISGVESDILRTAIENAKKGES